MILRMGPLAHLIAAGLALGTVACASALEPSQLEGVWGGEHVEVTFDASGAGRVEYDCAAANMSAPIIGSGGTFDATGEFLPGHGGPVMENEIPVRRPATFHGTISANRFSFSVTLTDSHTVIGPWSAFRGRHAQLLRCL